MNTNKIFREQRRKAKPLGVVIFSITLFSLFFLFLFSSPLNLISAEEFGYNYLEPGENLNPIRNLSMTAVNVSDFTNCWITSEGVKCDVADILHNELSNLAWSVAGHTIDANVDFNDYNASDVGTINLTEGIGSMSINGAGYIRPSDGTAGIHYSDNIKYIGWDVSGSAFPEMMFTCWNGSNNICRFEGNILADDNITTKEWFNGQFNWTTTDDWSSFDGSIFDFNESKLSTIYYNATEALVIKGTIDGGVLDDTQHPNGNYDGTTFNFSEEAGSPGLDLRVNFTDGIESFNNGIMRYKTSTLAGDFPIIQLWDYDDMIWEDYPQVIESESFVTISQPVFDSSEHVGTIGLEEGVVQMRIYKAGNGNTQNHYFIDWLAISKGFGTPAGEETDPIFNDWLHNSIFESNLNVSNYNITEISWINGFNQINGSGAINTTGKGTFGNIQISESLIYHDAPTPSDFIIQNKDGLKDIVFKVNDDGVDWEVLRIIGATQSIEGFGATATGSGAFALGSTASGTSAFAAGYSTTASGSYSFSVGVESQSIAQGAFSAGQGCIAGGEASVSIGSNVIVNGRYSGGFGGDYTNDIDSSFTIGYTKKQLEILANEVNLYSDVLIMDTSDLGSELILNPSFQTPPGIDDWNVEGGNAWRYSAYGRVEKFASATEDLTQSVPITIIVGHYYKVVYKISSWSVGSVTPTLGGVSLATIGEDGTFEEVIQATNTDSIRFVPTLTSRFKIDQVSVKEVLGGDLDVTGSVTIGIPNPTTNNTLLTVYGNITAYNFVDLTPADLKSGEEALESIRLISNDIDGNIDHNTLSDFVKAQVPRFKDVLVGEECYDRKDYEKCKLDYDAGKLENFSECEYTFETCNPIIEKQVDYYIDGRNIGNQLSELINAFQELDKRNQLLKSELCAKDNSYSWCAGVGL